MKYTVKNFKIFDEKGVTFDIAPITMLTGCNSSGKSSLVKSMMVLGEYLKKVKSYLNTVSREDKIDALAQPLDFAAGVKDTGGFDNVLNEHNTNGLITFQYTVDSKLLMEEVTVTLSFEKDPNDTLGRNGRLHEMLFQRADGTEFYRIGHSLDGDYANSLIDLAVIKAPFMDFALKAIVCNFEDRINEAKQHLNTPDWSMRVTKTEYEKEKKLIETYTARLTHIKNSLPSDFDYSLTKLSKEKKEIFAELLKHQTFDDDDIVALYKYRTVHYLPWLQILENIEKKDIRKTIEDTLKNVELSENDKFCLEYILRDFEDSQFSNFNDYFRSIEDSNSLHFSMNLNGSRETKGLIWVVDLNYAKYFDTAILRRPGWWSLPHVSRDILEKDIDSCLLYAIMAYLYGKLDSKYAETNVIDYGVEFEIVNHISESLKKYFEALFKELLVDDVPEAISNIFYMCSNRAIAQRLYSFDKQDSELNHHIKVNIELQHVYDTVMAEWKKEVLHNAKFHEKKKDKELEDYTKEIDQIIEQPKEFVEKWLQEFEICDAYSIDTVVANGVTIGCSISLEKNGKKHSIADEGYGCIQIFTVILAIQNIAYKFFIDALEHDKLEKSAFAVEEPENHLHPKLQSLLADMFQDASEKFGMTFIVETHSEYLIRKSQVLVKKWYEENKDTDKPCPFQAYYIPVNGVPYSLGYRKDGKFSESFGPGFYDESANLTFEIM